MNQSFGLQGAAQLTKKKLLAADQSTERLVKKAEAAFKVMPVGTPEFDHYTPAAWLLQNPAVLDRNTPDVTATLQIFEAAIDALNACL